MRTAKSGNSSLIERTLTARSVIVIVIVIAALSLVGATLSLLRTPDSGGMGGDSFGTRSHGYRAIFEILQELGVSTHRQLAPPTEPPNRQRTLVFWNSHPALIGREPAYFKPLARWIRQGGRLVVALGYDHSGNEQQRAKPTGPARETTNIFKELGLAEVTVAPIDRPSDTTETGAGGDDGAFKTPNDSFDQTKHRRSFREEFRDVWSAESTPTRSYTVRLTGTFASLQGLVRSVQLPSEGLQVVDVGDREPSGTVTLEDDTGTERILVAAFRLGKGEAIVVGDPGLASNRSIAKQDNSILTAHLLATNGREVIFDEFYHGLGVRGNPLWLLTRRSYLVVTLCLLALVGLWAWRQSTFLGPPKPPERASRRSIAEYVEAMARFLHSGRSGHPFVLRAVRAGVLRTIGHELGLPAGREGVEEVSALLARRDPQRAERLRAAIGSVDSLLARRDRCREEETVDALRRICTCLSNPAIERSGKKSRK